MKLKNTILLSKLFFVWYVTVWYNKYNNNDDDYEDLLVLHKQRKKGEDRHEVWGGTTITI